LDATVFGVTIATFAPFMVVRSTLTGQSGRIMSSSIFIIPFISAMCFRHPSLSLTGGNLLGSSSWTRGNAMFSLASGLTCVGIGIVRGPTSRGA
jgi:hypothetical protein